MRKVSWIERVATLEPALVRGFIVTAFGLVTIIFGSVVDNETVDLVVKFVLTLLGLISAIVIRPAVTANGKVLAFVRNPLVRPLDVEAGEATVPPSKASEVVDAAVRSVA